MTRHVADWGGAYLLERRTVAAIVDRVMPAEGRSLAGYGRASFAWAERRGCVLRSRREDHEISMLSPHLLQNCMVLVNSLMLPQVLARPQWAGRLMDRGRKALTPLIWESFNPWRRQELDVRARIAAPA